MWNKKNRVVGEAVCDEIENLFSTEFHYGKDKISFYFFEHDQNGLI